ncbi:MAG: LPS-assembly protein LptD [Gammaproteobacteria bacterium]|nr:LPS-assembly protein LptD [Gammaproteobacteria bacterium]
MDKKTSLPLIYAWLFWGLTLQGVVSATPLCPDIKTTQCECLRPLRGCHDPYLGPPLSSHKFSLKGDLPISFEAEQSQLTEAGLSILEGKVNIQQGEQQLEAARATYQSTSRILTLEKGFQYKSGGLGVIGDQATADLSENTLILKTLQYFLDPLYASGMAEELKVDENNILTLKHATYTTCWPQSNTWEFKTGHLTLNPKTGFGVAKNSVLKIKNIPVLYVPRFKFPIDDRRHTGFLPPAFGYSSKRGKEIILPFYWNIASNLDATLTPRFLSDRGLQLQTEFRYLTQTTEGELNVEWLPHDKLQEDTSNRNLVKLMQNTKWSPHTQLRINATRTSDKDYFEDLGDNLSLASLSHLEQSATFLYQSDPVNSLFHIQGFQTLDRDIADQNRPFEQLPRLLTTTYHPFRNGLTLSSKTELVYFRRDTTSPITDQAVRASIQPNLSWLIQNEFGRLVPSLSYLFTYYDLDQPVSPGGPKTLDRGIPTFSMDGRLFLERQHSFFSTPFIQTLEPRVFYLYVPERSQDDIPIFDSSATTLNFLQLFRTVRFSGLDRIGDDHHVTVALSSRMLNQATGQQAFQIQLGQAFFLRDRKVTLDEGVPKETAHTSPLIGELTVNLKNRFTIMATSQWDYEKDNFLRHALGVNYQGPHNHIANLYYQFRDPNQNQLDGSVAFPIGSAWRAFGRYYYDLKSGHALEYFYGVEYASCCWAIRVLNRKQIERQDKTRLEGVAYDTALWVQLELKGFTGVGKKVGQLLESSITGYRDTLGGHRLVGF